MTQIALQRLADIKESSLKDVQIIELQSWGFEHCGWNKPK